MTFQERLSIYRPWNEQEEQDRQLMHKLLTCCGNLYTRDQRFSHITASAWVTNQTRDRFLMAYHHIFQSWSWLGGHADGDEDLLRVAIKEAREEAGVTRLRVLSEELFSIEILPVSGHEKSGQYVSSHLHLNATFLLEADEREAVMPKPDENSKVRWFTASECLGACSEEWMRERIYRKLLSKMERVSY